MLYTPNLITVVSVVSDLKLPGGQRDKLALIQRTSRDTTTNKKRHDRMSPYCKVDTKREGTKKMMRSYYFDIHSLNYNIHSNIFITLIEQSEY